MCPQEPKETWGNNDNMLNGKYRFTDRRGDHHLRLLTKEDIEHVEVRLRIVSPSVCHSGILYKNPCLLT